MELLLAELNDSGATIVPEPNKYYTFVYKAKTPGIEYDQHPFIQCLGVYNWGFTGFNYHWQESRRYTWQEVRSNLFEIPQAGVEMMQSYPTQRLRMS